MNNLKDFALGIIGSNPQIAQNPNAQQMLECIKNNDNVRGQQIAENLCKTYGVKHEQAIQQARSFFHM